jgi:hypothetical protein
MPPVIVWDIEQWTAIFAKVGMREIAEYCESDVVNTYRVWLRHELFQRE